MPNRIFIKRITVTLCYTVLQLTFSAVAHAADKDSVGNSKDTDQARKTLRSFSDEDAKLRSSYREIELEHQRVAATAANAALARTIANNKRNSSDLRSQNASLANKLDNEIKEAKPKLEEKEKKFKDAQEGLLKKINAESLSAIRVVSESSDGKATEDLLRFLETFAFDPKTEVAGLRVSVSFTEQDAWRETVLALSKRGKPAIPELIRAIESSFVPVKFAAISALGEIGAEVRQADPRVVVRISEVITRTKNSRSLDRTEMDRRCKILKTAMDKIDPPK